jgi:membrane-bound lytic murein transglycosylase MltF
MKTTKPKRGSGFWFVAIFLLAVLALPGSATAGQTDEQPLETALIEYVQQPWKGDLDGMVERGFLRILVAYNPLFISYDGLEQRGLAVELSHEFEKHLRKELGKKARNLNVVLVVVPRDELIPALLAGRGDIVAANLTITPERERLVAFGLPNFTGVSELVVTGPAAPDVRSFDDLVLVGLHIRRSSSYFEHVSSLNEQRTEAAKKPVPVDPADERLEDYDLLEMVDAGLVPAIIVDSHKAAVWAQVFENIKVHETLTVNTGGDIAWAMRKENPKLLHAANKFTKLMHKGSLLGNILFNRYLSTDWIDNVMSPQAREKFLSVSGLMKKYADQYGFDWLMVAAQGYQESKFDQKKRSAAGAVGIMQLLPTTAADPNVRITDIHLAEQNIHAGIKYLNYLQGKYFSDDAFSPLDQVLFSFGAYNAGPRNIAKARARAKKMGLDPNRWFSHVEVAVAKTVNREPVVYVRNIFKYYVTYKKLEQADAARQAAKAANKE